MLWRARHAKVLRLQDHRKISFRNQIFVAINSSMFEDVLLALPARFLVFFHLHWSLSDRWLDEIGVYGMAARTTCADTLMDRCGRQGHAIHVAIGRNVGRCFRPSQTTKVGMKRSEVAGRY